MTRKVRLQACFVHLTPYCSFQVGFEVHIGSFHSALTNKSMTLTVMMEAVRCARAEGLKTAVLSNNFLLPGGKSYMPLDPSVFDVVK